jgi:hypothetical protein
VANLFSLDRRSGAMCHGAPCGYDGCGIITISPLAGERRLKGFGRAGTGATGIENLNRYLKVSEISSVSSDPQLPPNVARKPSQGYEAVVKHVSIQVSRLFPQITIVLNSNLVAYSILPSQSWESAVEIHRDSRKFVEIGTMLLLIQFSYQDG